MAEVKKKSSVKITTEEALNAERGKVPPQAPEAEEVVLGTLMLEREAYATVADILVTDSFYKEAHQTIFQAIKHLFEQYKPIDLLMVTQELRDRGKLDEVGGELYITHLTNRVSSDEHIETHARIIADKYLQRELIRVASAIQIKSYDSEIDVDDLIDFSEMALFQVAEGNIKRDTLPIDPILKQAVELIQEASKREDGLSGIPSGFTDLDRITSGWQKTDMVVLAARPSMGKTAFVLSMARNMAVEHKAPIAFFSLEMSALQLVNRLIIAETKLGSEKIKNGRLKEDEWVQLHQKLSSLEGAPLYIDDTPALSVFEFRAKCRRLKMKYNIGCVIVDYLQLMTTGADIRASREQEVSNISRSLKAIAKELDITIITLSQLNRSVESREGRRPQLSDLRESGAIEQDADIVCFIHRPEYYGITQDQNGEDLPNGYTEIIIAKHRNGATGELHLHFNKQFAEFTELDYITPFALEQGVTTKTIASKINEEDTAEAYLPDSNYSPKGQDTPY
jgi:replicative DNA helicase